MTFYVWDFAEDADSADFNAQISDLPLMHVIHSPSGSATDGSNFLNITATTYPGTADIILPYIKPLLGGYLVFFFRQEHNASGMDSWVKVDLVDQDSNRDQLFENHLNPIGTPTIQESNPHIISPDLTGLSNCGDVTNEAITLEFFMKVDTSSMDFGDMGIISGTSGTLADYGFPP